MNEQPPSRHGADDRGAATVKYNPEQARFGKMFDLPKRLNVSPFPEDLGMPGGPMDGGLEHRDNPDIPAVMTYFGQFVAHDITFDTTSSLERQNDSSATMNFRTPALELDNLYGLGPVASPFLYDQRPTHAMKMLLGTAIDDSTKEIDLPRNRQGVALIGDPRNDENLIVAQLHVAFLKFHNAVVDQLPHLDDGVADATLFEKAQRLVRWHYQWLILHHFLPAIAGHDVVDAVSKEGRRFYRPAHIPFIPVEFSVAAYRFGHSMVQPRYGINDETRAFLFPLDNPATPPAPPEQKSRDLRGGPIRFDERVNWKNFVNTGARKSNVSNSIQSSRIDTRLAGPLLNLPHSVIPPHVLPPERSLAVRNLRRGVTLELPSGQAIACHMAREIDITPLSEAELWDGTDFTGQPAPFWYYVLREAAVRREGKRLGPIGARIVVEVFLGLLACDRQSFLVKKPVWKPVVEGRMKPDATDKDAFTFVDLFRIAGTDVA